MKYYMLYYGNKNENWLGKPTNALIQATDIHQAAEITMRVLRSDFYAIAVAVIGAHNDSRILELTAECQELTYPHTVKFWLGECELHTMEAKEANKR